MTVHSIVYCNAVMLIALASVVSAQPDDLHSLCMPDGPPPVTGYQSYEDALNTRGQYVIPNVPCYDWRHGCGPTAVGMALGYYDGLDCPALIPGSAAVQNTVVNRAIANNAHYNDYSQPLDDFDTGLIPDASYYGGAHEANCLADFMETSWYSSSNIYGWSRQNHIDNSWRDYVSFINVRYGLSYEYSAWGKSWELFSWSDFTDEMDDGHPMVFLVDTDGDNETDHFITAIGYRDTSGYQEYACFDTWSSSGEVRWERFRGEGYGVPWGIAEVTYFRIDPGCGTTMKTQPEPTQTVCGGDTIELSVSTSATSPSYQWRRGQVDLVDDDVHVFGATTDTLVIQGVEPEDGDANYYCVIYDAVHDCEIWSQSAEVIIDSSSPTFITQPADVASEEGGFAVIQVVVENPTLYEYQWLKDGAPLSDGEGINGSQSAMLVLINLESSDAGSYECFVTARLGMQCSRSSEAARLTVNEGADDCPEDLNGDETVNLPDLAALLGHYGETGAGPEQGDFDGDGEVSLSDLAQLLGVYGQACPTR